MKMTIIIPIKKIEKFNNEAIKEYAKRLSRYCKLTIVKATSESEAIKKTPTNSYIIGVSSSCDTLSSEQLSETIKTLGINGQSSISFVLIDNIEQLTHYDMLISISKMKLSKDLEAVIMLEQIYRSYRIMNNQTYHK